MAATTATDAHSEPNEPKVDRSTTDDTVRTTYLPEPYSGIDLRDQFPAIAQLLYLNLSTYTWGYNRRHYYGPWNSASFRTSRKTSV